MKRGRDEKKEGVTQNHGFPYRKEGKRQLAWPGPWKLRRAGGYRPGGFHIGNLIKGQVVL
jgi:hypothetical protein